MKKSNLEKRTIRLYAGDAEKLAKFFPQVGYNLAIRTMVRNTIKKLEEEFQQKLEASGLDDFTLTQEDFDD